MIGVIKVIPAPISSTWSNKSHFRTKFFRVLGVIATPDPGLIATPHSGVIKTPCTLKIRRINENPARLSLNNYQNITKYRTGRKWVELLCVKLYQSLHVMDAYFLSMHYK